MGISRIFTNQRCPLHICKNLEFIHKCHLYIFRCEWYLPVKLLKKVSHIALWRFQGSCARLTSNHDSENIKLLPIKNSIYHNIILPRGRHLYLYYIFPVPGYKIFPNNISSWYFPRHLNEVIIEPTIALSLRGWGHDFHIFDSTGDQIQFLWNSTNIMIELYSLATKW